MTVIFGFVVFFLCCFVVAVGIAGGGVGVGGIFELACCFNFSIYDIHAPINLANNHYFFNMCQMVEKQRFL